MNWLPKMSMYMGIIREKQRKNRRKTKSHARNGKIRSTTGTHGRVSRAHDRASLHHGPCIPPPWAVRPPRAARGGHCPARSIWFSNDAFWLPLDLDLGCWIFMYWAYFATLLDLHASPSFSLDSTHTFLLETWLESYKSAINTQQAKTEHN